jgi:hypothetical protein
MKNPKYALFPLTIGVVVALCASVMTASADRQERTEPRDVEVTGKVIDLHCFMTGKFPAKDEKKWTQECIRAGVPVALETEDGLILLGKGTKGIAKEVAPFVLKRVEVKGKLFERHGVRYLDVAALKPAVEEDLDEWPESEDLGWDSDAEDQPEIEEPQPDDPWEPEVE